MIIADRRRNQFDIGTLCSSSDLWASHSHFDTSLRDADQHVYCALLNHVQPPEVSGARG
jgi:hypothetical protein